MNLKLPFLITAIQRSSCCSLWNYQTTLKVSGTLVAGANNQYLCMLVCGKALHQLDKVSDEVVSTTSESLKPIILVLGTYFFPVKELSKQKRVMRRGMRNPLSLKVWGQAACMIDLNKHLAMLHGAKAWDEYFEIESNEMFWTACLKSGAGKHMCGSLIVHP